MDWIHRFQLFLFDFDGLLVDTERLHYQAYQDALSQRGYPIDWTFIQFCQLAHLNAEALKDALCLHAPGLKEEWSLFYEEKKQMYETLLRKGHIQLMPGVFKLLEALQTAKISSCTVTNSFRQQTLLAKAALPILNTIPHWITREDYDQPKPNSESYLKAIRLYGKAGDRIIGFEDSLRGLKALQGTPALPVLICSPQHPLKEQALLKNSLHFSSFEAIDEIV